MFNWIRRAFPRTGDDARRRMIDLVDALNAATSGGKPAATARLLGKLKLPSGTLVLGDPQSMPALEITGAGGEAAISASLRRYPSGDESVMALTLRFGDATGEASRRKIGVLAIDSAKLVVADKDDFEKHWTCVGRDRIGKISTARGDTLVRMLTKRFKLRTVPENVLSARIVGPVSEQLENQITEFLQADPRYAQYPFLHFNVQTNNSFERVNDLTRSWAFIPVGNADTPLMFVCVTGHGDGSYEVQGEFVGDKLRLVSIVFIEDDTSP